MSFYGSSTRDKADYKAAQREREAKRQQNIRDQIKATSFSNVWAETNRQVAEAKTQQEAKRMAPILKAQQEQEQIMRDLRKVNAKNLLSQPDDDRFVEPASVTSEQEKLKFIHEQYALFVEDNPEWIDSQENRDALGKYFHVNKIILPTVKTIGHAAERLEDAGLIKRKAAPKPEPEPQPWNWVQDLNFDTAKDDDIVAGRNIETGEPASYTYAQVKQFSTEEYRRFISKDFRNITAEKPEYREIGQDPETREQRFYTAREIDKMDAGTIRKTFVLGRKLANVVQQPDL